jgi:hypothetical protein
MKDLSDKATIELLPIAKKRGRPTTGKAKTPAERQATYRDNKKYSGNIEENLNIWIESQTIRALDRLAKNKKITRSEMLKKLINKEDEKESKKAALAGKWEEYRGIK